jgi:hypothetical protein
LALKAQAQSRATIQALIELKYPKQTNFVKQANIANGHQQINNGQAASNETNTRTYARAPAKEIPSQHNELLSDLNKSEINQREGSYENMDTTSTPTPS